MAAAEILSVVHFESHLTASAWTAGVALGHLRTLGDSERSSSVTRWKHWQRHHRLQSQHCHLLGLPSLDDRQMVQMKRLGVAFQAGIRIPAEPLAQINLNRPGEEKM